jgi:hypothetical protein
MAEDGSHPLQGRKVGIKMPVEVSAHPFLVAFNLGSKIDLVHPGGFDPLAELLTSDIIDRRGHGRHGLNDNQIVSHFAADYTIKV